jgi:HAE1 family hydrophobic/amphiphilic exporter-1
MTSQSSLGRSQITVQFDLGRDIDGAALDVQTALSVAARRLPVEMTTPPFFRKVNPGDFPILYISLNSPTLPMSTVDEYGQNILAQQISQIPGVAQVLIYGSQKFAVRVQVDPVAAAARNISLEDVRTVLSKANSNTPVGTLTGPDRNVTLLASGALRQASDYKDIVAAWRNGSPVKLSEIANVIDSVENDQIASWFNNARAVVLAIQRQPDANTVEVVDLVRQKLPQFRAQVPPSIRMETLLDRSDSVRDAVWDVQETLLIAFCLVIMVIFLFLRSASATIIPALAVPISLIGTFAVMYLFGFSINNMTLLALTLSVGFVVDDAIVMLENIVRHIEGGMRPFEAALKGAREISFTIISITFSLIAVFIPVLLMGGIVGRVFREFAVTIAVAIVLSGFVSLTLTPMLCARVLRGHHDGEKKQNIVLRAFERVFLSWLNAYQWTLDKVIAYKAVMLIITFATIIGTVWLYFAIPKGFFPREDTSFVLATTEAQSDISFAAMAERQRKVADIIRADPAVAYANSTVGVGGPNTTVNQGRISFALKSKKERGPMDQVLARLRRATGGVTGMKVSFRVLQNINVGGRISKGEYQYTLQSSETETLYKTALEMRDKIAKIDGLLEVDADLYITNPQLMIDVDREKAAVYGITIDQVRQELFNAFGARQVATIYTDSNDYQVILETKPEFRADPSALSKIFVKTTGPGAAAGTGAGLPGQGIPGAGTPSGQSIPLSAVTKPVQQVGPLLINHQGQQPSVTISFNLAPGVAVGDATAAIRAIERESNLPATVTTGFQGNAQVFEQSLKGQGILILAAIFAAFVVLGILYESFIHPITIISGLPSAGIGALLTLILFKMDLSVIAMIGIVMLVGIVKKNAIMMVDFAIERRRVGLSAEAAIREACLLRFRPIMMTTFAAIFGALPIALGTGAGAELRQPLGISVVGGLILSQLLTLYITPVVYLYLDRVDRVLKRRLEPQLEEVGEPPRKPAVAAE